MFYNKKMKELSPRADHSQVNQIYKSLYTYSDQNLLNLFDFEIFRLLFSHFLKQIQNPENLRLKGLVKDE